MRVGGEERRKYQQGERQKKGNTHRDERWEGVGRKRRSWKETKQNTKEVRPIIRQARRREKRDAEGREKKQGVRGEDDSKEFEMEGAKTDEGATAKHLEFSGASGVMLLACGAGG